MADSLQPSTPTFELGTRVPRVRKWSAGATTRATPSDSGGISCEGQADFGVVFITSIFWTRLRPEARKYGGEVGILFHEGRESSGAAANGIDESHRLTFSALLVARDGRNCPVWMPKFFAHHRDERSRQPFRPCCRYLC